MKRISNDEAMEIFRNIECIKKDRLAPGVKIKQLQDDMIEDLSFLVYSSAKKYKRFNNYEDLVQEGFVGLIRAVQRFDYKRFPNFFVFANQWIINNIRRAAKKYDVVYNPSRSKVVYVGNIDLVENNGVDEIAPDDYVLYNERKSALLKEISKMSGREQTIVKNIYGIDEISGHTLRGTEKFCGLTYERIRQIKNKAVKKLSQNKDLLKTIN